MEQLQQKGKNMKAGGRTAVYLDKIAIRGLA